MLPELDGIEVCRQLRQFSDAYVIMLTARAEEIDKLLGLTVGADDYLTKPFSPRELVARIKARLRRPRQTGAALHTGEAAPMRDYDLGDTAMPQDSPLTTVQGTVNAIATADGRAYSSLAPDKIAHTFTLPQLNVNVPLPGDGMNGKDYTSVTFTFRTGAPGTYIFRCFDPCGTGPMGMMGPMMTQGYMIGTLTIQ
jgi:hypothetical protein